MSKVKVDTIGPQSLKARFATCGDMRRAQVARSTVDLLVSKERTDFGDDDRLFAASEFFQRLPQDLLGQSETIAFRRVEEIDSGVERGLDHVARSCEVVRSRHIAVLPIVAPRPGHRSETDRGNVQIGPAKLSILHRFSLAEAIWKSTPEEAESLSGRSGAGAVAAS